jgi:hypothetical protein
MYQTNIETELISNKKKSFKNYNLNTDLLFDFDLRHRGLYTLIDHKIASCWGGTIRGIRFG